MQISRFYVRCGRMLVSFEYYAAALSRKINKVLIIYVCGFIVKIVYFENYHCWF